MTLNLCENGDRWWCFAGVCHTKVGLRRDTWLDNSNLFFRKVVLICYCWSKNSISIRFCKHELGINKNTIVEWNKCVSEVNTADLLAHPVILGGPNITVGVDESLFTRRKIFRGANYNNKGNLKGNTWVFWVYCSRQWGCSPTLNNTGSLWAAYVGIQAMGYTELPINHTYEFVDPVPGAYTQNMENSTWDTSYHAW